MTETFMALVPQFGVYLVGMIVFLSALAIPLPGSMLVMVGGGFVASGDMELVPVLAAAFLGVVLGDQTAYTLARQGRTAVMERMRRSDKRARQIDRAEALIRRRGMLAVFLSRTVLSPAGPYVSYVSGAGGFGRLGFSMAAIPGAVIWSAFYVGIGYRFADHLSEIASLIGNALGLITAATVLVLMGLWLIRGLRDTAVTEVRPEGAAATEGKHD